jgi:hypothetical protein
MFNGTTRKGMTLLVLDAGAFIAHDRGDDRVREILDAILRRGGRAVSPSVALCALDGSLILTSDVADLEHLTKTLNREVLVQHV